MNRAICRYKYHILYCKNLVIDIKNGLLLFGYARYNPILQISKLSSSLQPSKSPIYQKHLTFDSTSLDAPTFNQNTSSMSNHVLNKVNGCIHFNDNPPLDMYQKYSLYQLIQNYFIMELCSIPMFVKNAEKLVAVAQSILGKKLCDNLIKATFFSQFVGGETVEDGIRLLQQLEQKGLSPFLAVPIEELPDSPEGKVDINFCPQAACFDRNIAFIKETLLAYDTYFKGKLCVTNFKLSALIPIKAMEEFGHKILPRLHLDDCNDLPGLKRNKEFTSDLSSESRKSILKGLDLLNDISQISREQKTKLLIDSEYSMINPTIQMFVKFLAKSNNQNFPAVGGTYQCYFKDAFYSILNDVEFCRKHKIHFSCKLVRGAYMEYERARAASLEKPSTICDTYEETCKNYNDIMSYCIDQIKPSSDTTNLSTPLSANPFSINHDKFRGISPTHFQASDEKFHFMVASHNVHSVNLALIRMYENSIPLSDPRISFAQLFGMCDYLTAFLAKSSAGKLYVYKNIPYGPVHSVIPYLLRRARENFSVFVRLDSEKRYLAREIKSRLSFKTQTPATTTSPKTTP